MDNSSGFFAIGSFRTPGRIRDPRRLNGAGSARSRLKRPSSRSSGRAKRARCPSSKSRATGRPLVVARTVPVMMGGPGNLDLLYHLALQEGVENVVETGVAFGWSSLAILLGLGSEGQLFSTDMPYVRRGNEDYVGCVVPEDLRGAWTLIRLADHQALPRALDDLGTIDLCHYDSDKTYVGRMWAYGLLWEALEPGGFFVSDDIGDNDAFRVFAESVAAEPIVVEPGRYDTSTKYVGVLRKK